MLVAALLDLGANRKKLDAALAPLASEGVRHEVLPAQSHGMAGLRFSVSLPHGEAPLPYPEGHDHPPASHVHRHLADVEDLISRLPMTDRARALAGRIFSLVADAEAVAHGVAKEEVHFHEVGALDSIADVVGIAVLADDLACDDCAAGDLTAGFGSVRAAHGVLPVPVPAVAEIARAAGLVLRKGDAEGERLTPTGIAAVAAMKTRDAPPERYRVLARGTGVGTRDFGRPNTLAVSLLEDLDGKTAAAEDGGEKEVVFEVDDATGEALAVAMGKLYEAGAKEVHFLPVFMKKNRPGWQVQAIAEAADLPKVAEAAFRHTTTIGLRVRSVERIKMSREAGETDVLGRKIAVKRVAFGSVRRAYPEADSVREAAEALGLSFGEVHALALAAAARENGQGLSQKDRP